jgi:hypothetical protein
MRALMSTHFFDFESDGLLHCDDQGLDVHEQASVPDTAWQIFQEMLTTVPDLGATSRLVLKVRDKTGETLGKITVVSEWALSK